MKRFWVSGVLFLISTILFAAPEKLNRLPSGTVEGYLENGLHYIILENDLPSMKAEYRLVMRVGAVQESDDNRGVAHFFEHMAFHDAGRFSDGGHVRYLESLGMKYGRDINAFTGYDRTIFMFSVPTDEEFGAVADTSLMILREWLSGVKFDPEKVEAERGVILEELRCSVQDDPFYSMKIGNGIFSCRMPLGRAEDIEKVTVGSLQDFYSRWYVPELAAVVVVGDVDAAETEKKIRRIFSGIPKRKAEGFEVYPLEYGKGLSVMQIRDTLQKNSKIDLMIPYRCIVERTIGDSYEKAVYKALGRAVYERFRNTGVDAMSFDSWYLSDKNHFGFTVDADNEADLMENFVSAYNELCNAARNGFLDEEVNAAVSSVAAGLDVNQEKELSSYLCDNFVDYIISGDRYLCDAAQAAEVRKMVEKITSRDLSSRLKKILSAGRKTMLVAVHDNFSNDGKIDRAKIEAALKEAETRPFSKVEARKETSSAEDEASVSLPELESVPEFEDSMIVSSREYPGMRVTSHTLSNGIELILKRTIDKDSTVNLIMLSPGGSSWLSKEDFPFMEGVAGYMELGGVEGIEQNLLSEYMYANGLSLAIMFDNNWHGMMGSAPANRSVPFFNLIVRKLTSPELCYDDFDDIKADMADDFGHETPLDKMIARDPARQLRLRMDELLGNVSPVRRPFASADEIADMDLDKIAAFYNDLFCATEGMKIIVSGNFDQEKTAKELAAAFSVLPSKSLPEKYTLAEFKLPEDIVTGKFDNNNESQTLFDYIFAGNYEPSLKNTLTFKIIRDIIHYKVISVLRGEESLVYSPYVDLYYNGLPYGIYYFDINASVSRSNTAKAKKVIDEILSDLKSNPVPDALLTNIKRSFLINKRETLTDFSPVDWRRNIENTIRNGETLEDFENYSAVLSSISAEDIMNAVKKYFDENRYILLYRGDFNHE